MGTYFFNQGAAGGLERGKDRLHGVEGAASGGGLGGFVEGGVEGDSDEAHEGDTAGVVRGGDLDNAVHWWRGGDGEAREVGVEQGADEPLDARGELVDWDAGLVVAEHGELDPVRANAVHGVNHALAHVQAGEEGRRQEVAGHHGDCVGPHVRSDEAVKVVSHIADSDDSEIETALSSEGMLARKAWLIRGNGGAIEGPNQKSNIFFSPRLVL
jgi:hypothetical protein